MSTNKYDLIMAAGAVAVVGAGLYIVSRKLLPALNPFNQDNAAASIVNKAGAILVTAPDGSGKNADGSWTLGGWLYDTFNPDTAQAVKDVSGKVVQRKNVTEPETWTPADPNTSSTWGA